MPLIPALRLACLIQRRLELAAMLPGDDPWRLVLGPLRGRRKAWRRRAQR